MSDLPFTYRNVPVPSPVGPITHDRRQLMAWCEGVDSALKHHAHRLGEFEGEGEPEHVPNDPGKAEWRAVARAEQEKSDNRAEEIFRLQTENARLRADLGKARGDEVAWQQQAADKARQIEQLTEEIASKNKGLREEDAHIQRQDQLLHNVRQVLKVDDGYSVVDVAQERMDQMKQQYRDIADQDDALDDRDREIEWLRQELAEKESTISYLRDSVEDYKQLSKPKESPSGPQPGDRVRGYASPVGYKTGVFREVEAKSFNNGDSAIRIEDDEGAWFLRGPTVRRVYAADSPEPPADVTVLRDSGEPKYFGVRTRSGWDWRLDPVTKMTIWGFTWDALAKGARGDLIEFQEGDDD